MKILKAITIDYDINQKLKHEKNASSLINNLLSNHYNQTTQKKIDVLNEILEKPIKDKQQKSIKDFEQAFIHWKPKGKELNEMKTLKINRIDYFRNKLWKN